MQLGGRKNYTNANIAVATVVHDDGTADPLFERSMIQQAEALSNNNGDISAKTIIVSSDHVILDPTGPGAAPEEFTSTQTTAVALNPVRVFRGRPVKKKNLHLPDSILAFKKRRQASTAVIATGGGVAGLLVLGPIGSFIFASLAYTVSKSIGKAREKYLTKKHWTNERLLAEMERQMRSAH